MQSLRTFPGPNEAEASLTKFSKIKDSDARKDREQEEKGATEDEMVG